MVLHIPQECQSISARSGERLSLIVAPSDLHLLAHLQQSTTEKGKVPVKVRGREKARKKRAH